MSGPGFTRPDLCSISAATQQAGFAGAVAACSAATTTRWSVMTCSELWRVMSVALSWRWAYVALPRAVRPSAPAPRGSW